MDRGYEVCLNGAERGVWFADYNGAIRFCTMWGLQRADDLEGMEHAA